MTRPLALSLLLLSACSDVENLGEIDHPVFGEPRWAISLGGVGEDRGVAVAMDPAGDVIAAGEFQESVDFGNGTVTATGAAGWISKRAAADGHALWTVTLGTEAGATASIYDVATDCDGAIIVAAMYAGTIRIEDRVLAGPTIVNGGERVLIKFDTNGRVIWIREFRTIGLSGVAHLTLAVGHDGRIVIGGTYAGELVFPNGSFSYPDPASFAAMFDRNGMPIWGAVGSHDQYIHSVAITPESDVIVSGVMPYRSTFAGVQMKPLAYPTQFAARMTASGEVLWAHVLGQAKKGRDVSGIALGPDGQTFLISTQRAPADASERETPTIDAVDSNGQSIWTRQPTSGVQANFSVALPDAIVTGGGVFAVARAGKIEYRSDFGFGVRNSHNFLVAHDMNGRLLDHSSIFDGCSAGARDIATNGTGGLAMVGGISEAPGFETCLRLAGKSDAVIMLLDSK